MSLLLASTLICSPARQASATGAVAGATELTQLLNNAQLVDSVAKQAQQLATQLNMYESMLKNLKTLPGQTWGNVANDLAALQRVVAQGQALSFAGQNIAAQFSATYPGYTQGTKYTTSYQNWSQVTMDTIKGSLAGANLQASQFASEEATLASLRAMSQNPEGQVQALQVGQQIAVEQTSQLQKLRGLMMAQMQSQNAFMANQMQDAKAKKGSEDVFFQQYDPRSGRNYKGF